MWAWGPAAEKGVGTPEVGCPTDRVRVCRRGRSPDVQGCRVRESGGGQQLCGEQACGRALWLKIHSPLPDGLETLFLKESQAEL